MPDRDSKVEFFRNQRQTGRDKIQASVKKGVLKIVLPKAEALKTKKITVKAEA